MVRWKQKFLIFIIQLSPGAASYEVTWLNKRLGTSETQITTDIQISLLSLVPGDNYVIKVESIGINGSINRQNTNITVQTSKSW